MKNKNTPFYTNGYKKIIFVLAFFASSIFNVLLFCSIGDNLGIALVWAIIGLSVVLFQTLNLREYFNYKRSIRYRHLSVYILCTIVSVAGTLGAGYSHIEKTRLRDIEKITKLEIIDRKIADIESPGKNYVEDAINTTMAGTNLNQWAVIRLIKEKRKIVSGRVDKYTTLGELKTERAQVLSQQSSVISSLSGVSRITGIKEDAVAFCFLVMAAVILELMLYGSATFKGKLMAGIRLPKRFRKKDSRSKRQEKAGQTFFFKPAA